MVSGYGTGTETSSASERPVVDPRAPRFGQAITATGLLAGIVLEVPAFVFVITVALVLAVGSQWRIDLYGILFANLVKPRLEPREPESATPHRFAKVIGALGTTIASGLLLAGFPLAGYLVAVPIVAAAGLGATTGFCLGCRLYRGVSLFQRLSIL